MKSKSIFLMAVSLGFGLVAAIGITQVMGRNNQPVEVKEEPKLPILVAVADVDINAELTPEMFSEEEWPARLVPEGAATSFEDLDGMVTTARIGKKGTVFLSNLLEKHKLREKKIPPGFKVIGMKMGVDDHLNGLLEAGDLVDIMAVFKGGSRNSTSGATSRTFLRKVTIWSIGSKTKKDIEQNASAKGSTVVGLLVTEKQAEMIMLAEKIAELKLAMRGKEDADPGTFSSGTGAGDLNDNSESVLREMMGSQQPKLPIQAPVQLSYAPDQFEMIIHTPAGPTSYKFDKDSPVATRTQGYAGDDEPMTDPAAALDFDGDEAGAGPESLIDDLDSEPGS